jgi:Domain of unknown function (DUF2017)
MTSTFARARGGRIKVRLGDADRGVVAGLLEAVADLLEPEDAAPADTEPAGTGPHDAGPADTERAPDAAGAGVHAPDEASLWVSLEADLAVEPPADPAVARLLPDASRDDPELAQSFRRLTEQDLRERKRDSLGLAAGAMRRPAPVVLDDSEAQALLKGLTDVRLVLAERLGIATDEDAEFLHAALAAGAGQGGQEWAKAAELYEVVTYLQEELVHTLLPSG